AWNFAATTSSVSPKSVRRSEWPTIAYAQPTSFSIAPETSPVYAPLPARAETSCDPSRMPEPLSRSATLFRYGYGGNHRIRAEPPAPTPAFNASTRAALTAREPCIFQFPATSLVRAVMASIRAPMSVSGGAASLSADRRRINGRGLLPDRRADGLGDA